MLEALFSRDRGRELQARGGTRPRPKAAAREQRVGELEGDVPDVLVRLADLLTSRQQHPSHQDETLMGLDQDASSTPSAGVRGAAQRERLMDALRLRPGSMSMHVAEAMQRRLGRAPRVGQPPEPRAYLERFGTFGDSRELGLVAWLAAGVLDNIWHQDLGRASDGAALLMVVLEQASLDRGNFDLAWLMSFEEDPPQQIFSRMGPQVTPRAFAPLARQQWATTNMAYLRELDVLNTRRADLARGQWNPRWNRQRGNYQQQQQGDVQQQQAGDAAAPGAQGGPKGKRKGKEKGD